MRPQPIGSTLGPHAGSNTRVHGNGLATLEQPDHRLLGSPDVAVGSSSTSPASSRSPVCRPSSLLTGLMASCRTRASSGPGATAGGGGGRGMRIGRPVACGQPAQPPAHTGVQACRKARPRRAPSGCPTPRSSGPQRRPPTHPVRPLKLPGVAALAQAGGDDDVDHLAHEGREAGAGLGPKVQRLGQAGEGERGLGDDKKVDHVPILHEPRVQQVLLVAVREEVSQLRGRAGGGGTEAGQPGGGRGRRHDSNSLARRWA